jgi:hypothetical protein
VEEVRAGAVALAFALFGCGKDPVFHCGKAAVDHFTFQVRECVMAELPDSFDVEKAHCVHDAMGSRCFPTAEECREFQRSEALGVCVLSSPSEYRPRPYR